MATPYAFMCWACHHRIVIHTSPVAELDKGVYRCKDCGCEIGEDGGYYGLSKREYEATLAEKAGSQ